MKLFRSLPAAALITLLSALSVGCTVEEKPGDTSSSGRGDPSDGEGASEDGTPADETDPETDPVAGEGAEPIATMHSAELVREFQTNAVRANELYAGKRVRVYGTVNSVDQDDDKIALVFKTSATTTAHLFCRFDPDRAAGLSSLNTGDEATADGTVVGIGGFTNGRLILEDCTLP